MQPVSKSKQHDTTNRIFLSTSENQDALSEQRAVHLLGSIRASGGLWLLSVVSRSHPAYTAPAEQAAAQLHIL
jgi:hypothetical protein